MNGVPTVVEQFGNAVLAQDFARAHELLAPWLAADGSADALRSLVARSLAYAAECAGEAEAAWPSSFGLDANAISVEELRSGTPALPSDITEENFLGWYCLEFGADDSTPFDLWVAAVTDRAGAARVGYLQAESAD